MLAPAILYITLLIGAPFILALYYSLSDITVGSETMHFVRSQRAQKRKAIDERHPQIHEDRVRAEQLHFSQASVRGERGEDLIAFQPQHPGERQVRDEPALPLEEARVLHPADGRADERSGV